jgi:hypothetical protein
MLMFLLLILNVCFFLLGNYIYTTDVYLVAKILISELAFIFLYTIVDKGNIQYSWKFTILSAIFSLQFMLPVYEFLFFSKSVQYFSVLIATAAIILNSLLIRKLLSKGLTKLLSSRISTSIASIFEICFFAFLLEIGIMGALITVCVRAVYITVIPYFIFRK